MRIREGQQVIDDYTSRSVPTQMLGHRSGLQRFTQALQR